MSAALALGCSCAEWGQGQLASLTAAYESMGETVPESIRLACESTEIKGHYKGCPHFVEWRDMASWTYFIQRGADGPIKIGKAGNPLVRLRSLQTGHDVELRLLLAVRGGEPLERGLHIVCNDRRLRGEWFDSSLPLILVECFASHWPIDELHPASTHPNFIARARGSR